MGAYILMVCMLITMIPSAWAAETASENNWNPDCSAPHQYSICGNCDRNHCEKCNKGHSTFYCVVYQEASCTQDKQYAHICNCCGQMMGSGSALLIGVSKTEKAHGHTFEDVSILLEGSCTEPGIKKQKCTECGETQYVYFYNHQYEDDAILEATCTEPMKVGRICAVCGAVDGEVEEVGEPLGHDEVETITKEPACGQEGEVTITCTRCDYTETRTIDALKHVWDEGVLQDADCTHGQSVLYTCQLCGETRLEETGLDEALGHDWDEGVVTEPTCTEAGYTLYTCKRCGETEQREPTEALEHDMTTEVVEPTCSDVGYTRHYCTRCDYVEENTDEQPIDPTKHVETEGKVLKEATCTTPGVVKMVCELCGAHIRYANIPAGHTWDEGEVTLAPTCAEAGEKTFTCTKCGETRVETLPATGLHAWTDERLSAKNDCVFRYCTVCGTYEILQTFEGFEGFGGECDETGRHIVVDVPEVPATTESEGTTAGKKCSACGVILEGCDPIPMITCEHEWDEGMVTLEPTCAAPGERVYTCLKCQETKTEEIEKLPHTEEILPDKEPACT